MEPKCTSSLKTEVGYNDGYPAFVIANPSFTATPSFTPSPKPSTRFCEYPCPSGYLLIANSNVCCPNDFPVYSSTSGHCQSPLSLQGSFYEVNAVAPKTWRGQDGEIRGLADILSNDRQKIILTCIKSFENIIKIYNRLELPKIDLRRW